MKTKIWAMAALGIAAISGSLHAQEAAVARVSRDGVVERVLVNPHGDPDGLLLRDGTLVRFPPHALRNAGQLRIGSEVHAEGEPATTPSGITLFEATVSTNGAVLTDLDAPPPAPPRPDAPPVERSLSVTGKVRILLTNPDGIVDGFLLADGTVVHAGPRARLSRLGLAPGVQVTVTGQGATYPQGRSLHAESLQVGDAAPVALRPRP